MTAQSARLYLAGFDRDCHDLEGILHSRSLSAAVAGVPTKVKFDIGEPYTSQTHTVSSIVWPVGAKGVPFVQQGSFAGETEFELSTPGLYVFQCRVHPYMLGAVVNDDPTTPGADLGKTVHWIDGTDMPTAADEILYIVSKFFIVTEPANWQYYSPDHPVVWDPQFPAAPVMTYNADGSPNLIPNLNDFFHQKYHLPQTLQPPILGTSGWHEVRTTFLVPKDAREGIFRIGLFGATGTACFDKLELKKVAK